MQKREIDMKAFTIDIIDMMCPQDVGNWLRLLVRHAGAIIGAPERNDMPKPLERSYDGIIVGAGHHGLILGTYLAKAGLDILVVERRLSYGGGLATEEVTQPGFYHNLSQHDAALRDVLERSPELRAARADVARSQAVTAFARRQTAPICSFGPAASTTASETKSPDNQSAGRGSWRPA